MEIKVNDITIHYEMQGNGPALLLLHGNGEDIGIFQKQIAFFSSCYQVIAIDTRAHGKSTRGTRIFDFNTFSDDIITFMDLLNIRQAHILGFSDGGNTALHVALKAPEKIKSLILVGANLFPEGMKSGALIQIRLAILGMALLSIVNKKISDKKELYRLMSNHPKLTFEDISAIRVPALIIAGDKDMIKDRHTRKIAGAIPNAELKIIPDSDHFVLFKKTDETSKIILDFLQNLKTASTFK